MKKEVAVIIVKMTNRAEAALYKDNNSIATIEDSIISKKLSTKHRQNKVNYNPLSI